MEQSRQQTLALIKPDGVAKKHIGRIIAMIEANNIRITAMNMRHLSKTEAEDFYRVHAGRSFFAELIDYMISGPIVAMRLEGDDVIERYRRLMGATDPQEADDGTIRKLYGVDKSANVVHGSDSLETAKEEIQFFFGGD